MIMASYKDLNLFKDGKFGLYIDGQWVTESEDKSTFTVINPSTTELVAEFPKLGRNETKKAIEAADRAFKGWAGLAAKDRSDYLLELHDLLLENTEELATIMAIEMGKAFKEAKGEVGYAASFLRWYAEEGRRVYGETIPSPNAKKRLFVIKQPVGVVAAITPWNFPLGMLTRKLAPALAAGCTSVIKPASQTTLSAVAFAKLVEQAGFPKGVINIVAGSTSEISDEIFDNPIVRKVSFTGSTAVGKDLVKRSAKRLKKLSLELGGHAPFLVFEDADLEKAAEGVLASKFRNAGQTCVCANRVYVQESVKDEFATIFVEKVKGLQVGNSLNEDTDIGPLVNESGLEKVIEHVEDAKAKGATVLHGGRRIGKTGYFYEPTVLDNVTNDMKIMNEETFGPVAPIFTFKTEDEAIELANNTEYGLAAYIYTNDINRAVKVSESIDFGVIGLNDPIPGTAEAPFGGMKESGYGREGGHHGIREYLEEKYISLEM